MVVNMLSWRIHNPNFNLISSSSSLPSSSLFTTHHHTQAQSHFFRISVSATTTRKIRLNANKTPIIDRDSPSSEEIQYDYDNDDYDDDVAVKKSDDDFDEEEDDDVSRIQVPKDIQNDDCDDDDDVAAKKIDGDDVAEKKSDDDFDKGEEDDVSRVQVPREGYIPVSKSDLLDAIVSTMFSSSQQQDDNEQDSNEVKEEEDKEEVNQFVLLSSCLDSVIHAEHKAVLEQMRVDYQHSGEEDEKEDDTNDSVPISDYNGGFNFKKLFSGESNKDRDGKRYLSRSRVAVATRFQSAFMQLLSNAQFEELSARDLMLTSALNTDYLLTLPVYVDWKRAYESNAIIFRRGYAIEREKGVLIGEKLDYIQSKILQKIFFLVSKPLGTAGIWITEALKNALETKEVRSWTERIKLWIKELSLIQHSSSYEEDNSDNGVDSISSRDLPIWLAAQRAVSRYEGLLSSVGPRERLLRKLLMWTGAITATPGTPFEFEIYHDSSSIKPYQRPINITRRTLDDIWRPATRKYCGNNIWKMLKTSVSILFSRSALQEPAFQELILLYTEDMNEGETTDKAEVPSLQLKIYDRIPIPDLPVISSDSNGSRIPHVVFPHKKLSFRIIDTVRLDVASIPGLLAFFINYKFEDILSSPSAVLLDAIALSAFIIYVSRVILGYKQTRDRYQLLVNKTLYEKTLASGFGSVHFLLDASEQQQYKEAILAYAVLLKAENGQVHCRSSVGDKCERFIYDTLKVKVKMPIEKAMDTLLRLGLVIETPSNERSILQALPCTKAYAAIKQRWNSLLH